MGNDVPPGRAKKAEGLEVHVVGTQCVVYDSAKDRVHYLNPTAAVVLELCDGNRSPEEIAAMVQEAYGLPAAPLEDVLHCVSSLQRMEVVL